MPKKKPADAPLSARIENDQLVISIGVSTLAFAAHSSPEGYMAGSKIVNPLGFAKDVLAELTDESETGMTTITQMLDQGCEAAADQGSEHVAETEK
jgi:hypothetical protein